MAWPSATRIDHQTFCDTEGWARVRDARGRTGTHHLTYELALPDGRVLRTRVSHPVDRTGYGKAIWAHILRDQLAVDEAVFWGCVKDGTLPERSRPAPPAESLPADLAYLLINTVGVPETEVAVMTRAQAIARVNKFWTTGI